MLNHLKQLKKMIVNETITTIIAIVIAYLIGSIPFAYIFTRLATGKDIRQLGSGNGGAHNVFRETGIKVAIPVALFDISKGTAAVFIAYRLLEVPLQEPNVFILLAALAAITGHIWSVYLKFKGGNGLSATFGALAIIMPWELLVAIGCLLVLTLVTRNLVLSTNLGLLSVPISAWFIDKSWWLVGFSIIVTLMLVVHFIPTAKKALVKAGNKENLTRELLRKDKR
jgi:acyl phosphate:glycerol-3-phosphate acyltransferase